MASVTRSTAVLLALIAMVASATAARMDPIEVAALEVNPGREQMDGCPKQDACDGKASVCNADNTAKCSCIMPRIWPPWEWTVALPCDDGLRCVEDDRSSYCVKQGSLESNPGREQMDGCPKQDACHGRTSLCNSDNTAVCSCIMPKVIPPWEWTVTDFLCEDGDKCEMDGRSTYCVTQ